MVPLNRFWTLTSPHSSLFHDPHFDSAFVVYIIGASVKQSGAVDRVDACVAKQAFSTFPNLSTGAELLTRSPLAPD